MRSEPVQRISLYPALPAPISTRLTVLPAHPCPYIPGRESVSRAVYASSLPGEVYHNFMDAGFRRSGRVIYQPVCRGCRACVPIRVVVDHFAPSKSQRRCWRRNSDLRVEVTDDPCADGERFDLYRRYIAQWHGREEPESREDFETFLYDSPVATIECSYRDARGALLAVGICDVCPAHSLSSVYFYFDPNESRRGLGTFGAMYEIELARQRAIPYYYLGYWVQPCGAMRYKEDFRPNELLGADGAWRAHRGI
jgi:arginyl-tRNA--protein-N-Asp/Glu arginylyltransferase